MLETMISKDDGFQGTLKNFRLTDLVQMCCISGTTTAIRVTQDSQQGTIVIKGGEIIHAICDEIVGEEAFYQIISWRKGSFETLNVSSLPEKTIEKGWEFLIMEGARMGDEQALSDPGAAGAEEKVAASPSEDRVRVLIVDDSPLMCRVLQELLTSDKRIAVVGVAHDGEQALRKIDELKPDLITLDVNMPVMDGGTALKHIMIKNPCPIVIVSKLGSKPPADIFDFLRLGAVDFISKPKKSEEMADQRRQLIERIMMAAEVRIGNFKRVKPPKVHPKAKDPLQDQKPCELLAVVSSSVGGYPELIKLMSFLPGKGNACLIVLQSMPLEFLIPFSDYLDTISGFSVLPIQGNVPLLAGRCYVGTNDLSLGITLKEGRPFLRLEDGRSSLYPGKSPFDLLLCSMADTFPGRILTVLLSGADVGDLDGLQAIKQRSGRIIVQELNCCLAPHSLRRVVQAHLVDFEGTHDEIAKAILQQSTGQSSEDLYSLSGRGDG